MCCREPIIRAVVGFLAGTAADTAISQTMQMPIARGEILIGSSSISGLRIIMVRCPTNNNGFFEFLSKNPAGYMSRSRTLVKGGQAVRTVIEIKAPNRAWVLDQDIDPELEVLKAPKVFFRVCPGKHDSQSDKKKFENYVVKNRKEIIDAGGTILRSEISE